MTLPVLTNEDKAAFGSEYFAETLKGPLVLARMVSSDPRSMFGKWWIEASYFRAVYVRAKRYKDSAGAGTEMTTLDFFRALMRTELAVCRDWNDFNGFCLLRLPAGSFLDAYIGFAAPQPMYSSNDKFKRSHPMGLRGKECQLAIDIKANGVQPYVSVPIAFAQVVQNDFDQIIHKGLS